MREVQMRGRMRKWYEMSISRYRSRNHIPSLSNSGYINMVQVSVVPLTIAR
jgi:hypothetical protein